MAEPAGPRVSYEAYLAAEARAAVRHEYCDGVILAMAGGSREHSLVKTNLTALTALALRGRPCRAFDSDLRALVEDRAFATYPDLAVVCGPIRWAARDRNALTNPTALFEVLSPSTAAYDLGEKFDQYASLTSLQEYVVVDSERIGVRLFRRDGDAWTLLRFGAGDVVELRSIQVRLAVSDLYEGWAELRASNPEG